MSWEKSQVLEAFTAESALSDRALLQDYETLVSQLPATVRPHNFLQTRLPTQSINKGEESVDAFTNAYEFTGPHSEELVSRYGLNPLDFTAVATGRVVADTDAALFYAWAAAAAPYAPQLLEDFTVKSIEDGALTLTYTGKPRDWSVVTASPLQRPGQGPNQGPRS